MIRFGVVALPSVRRRRICSSCSESRGCIDLNVVELLLSDSTESEKGVGLTGFSVESGSIELIGRCDSGGFIDGTGLREIVGRFAVGDTVVVMIE